MPPAPQNATPASPNDVPKRALFLIFVIAFLNTMGMTIVIPVVPFLAQRYVSSPSAVALWVGILTSAYAVFAFLAAPALGALSDRIGRKPVLLGCVLGSAVGFVVFGIGGAMWVLLLARIIDGVTGGNFSTIYAYLADITAPEQSASRFGMTGAIMGIGFMVGPAIGGLLAVYGLATPVFVAAAISVAAAVLGMFVLPESLNAEHRSDSFSLADVHPFTSLRRALARPELRPFLLIVLVMTIPMAGLQSNVSVFGKDVLAWGPTQIGLYMTGVGVLDILVQGGLVRFLLPRIGERGVVFAGLIGQAIGYLALAIVAVYTSAWLFVFGGLLFAASEGGTGPALQGLISRSVSHREQGWVMGGLASMSLAARAIGPLLAGVLYASVGHAAPYWFGLAVIAGVLTLGWGTLFAGREVA